MTKYITKAQREELEDASFFGVEGANDLLEKYVGIKARSYTMYNYYDENGDYIGNSNDSDLGYLLEQLGVGVLDNG